MISIRSVYETISRTTAERALSKVTRTVDTPFSDTDQVSVSKYGLVVSSTGTSGLTTTHYNAKGLVDWGEDAAGFKHKFAYDPQTGQKTLETNALGKEIRTVFLSFES